jgi:hypothetical protein
MCKLAEQQRLLSEELSHVLVVLALIARALLQYVKLT